MFMKTSYLLKKGGSTTILYRVDSHSYKFFETGRVGSSKPLFALLLRDLPFFHSVFVFSLVRILNLKNKIGYSYEFGTS